ncbi:MAG TPA: protein translocase subunit SecF [Candidatus Angelobacter sp.]|nr:protein translocase subunit SecF [Candidatus Angelobacter sp.]
MYDLVGRRRWYYVLSALFIVPGLLFILLGGLRPSIDFTGGTEWEVRHAEEPTAGELADALADLGYEDATVSDLEDGFVRVRTRPIDLAPPQVAAPSATPSPSPSPTGSPDATASPDQTASPTEEPSPSPAAGPTITEGTPFAELQGELADRFGTADIRLARTVGPLIGAELIRNSAILIIIGELLMLGYLWIRFGFRYGTAAVIALLHDVLFVVGVFAILGYFFAVEIDALFVTALLTIIAFSVNDTIVVFDRIRENRVRRSSEPFGAIVNHSLLQTLGRSLLTGLTLLVPIAALVLLGPATIRGFALTLLLGMGIGVYSSIFNAAQILVDWHEWAARRKRRAAAAAR